MIFLRCWLKKLLCSAGRRARVRVAAATPEQVESAGVPPAAAPTLAPGGSGKIDPFAECREEQAAILAQNTPYSWQAEDFQKLLTHCPPPAQSGKTTPPRRELGFVILVRMPSQAKWRVLQSFGPPVMGYLRGAWLERRLRRNYTPCVFKLTPATKSLVRALETPPGPPLNGGGEKGGPMP